MILEQPDRPKLCKKTAQHLVIAIQPVVQQKTQIEIPEVLPGIRSNEMIVTHLVQKQVAFLHPLHLLVAFKGAGTGDNIADFRAELDVPWHLVSRAALHLSDLIEADEAEPLGFRHTVIEMVDLSEPLCILHRSHPRSVSHYT